MAEASGPARSQDVCHAGSRQAQPQLQRPHPHPPTCNAHLAIKPCPPSGTGTDIQALTGMQVSASNRAATAMHGGGHVCPCAP